MSDRRPSGRLWINTTARAHGWTSGFSTPRPYYVYIHIYIYIYTYIFICSTYPIPVPFSLLAPHPLPITYYLLPVNCYPLPITHYPLPRPKRPSSSPSVVSAGPGALNSQLIQRFIEWQHCSEYNHSSRESLHSSYSLYPTRSYDYPAPPASLSRSFLASLQLGSTLAQVTVSI